MPNILIVEDEVSLRLALGSQLSALGKVVEARDEREALNSIETMREKEEPLHLAAVDLRLPGESGIDPDAGFRIVGVLDENFPGIPVIVLTIRNDKDAWGVAKDLEPVRFFFTKPWDSSTLQNAAKQCLNGKSGASELVGTVEDVSNGSQ